MAPDRRLRRVAAGLLIILALPAGRAFAQGCCAPGSSPLGGLGGPGLDPGSVQAGLLFDDYRLNQAYRGSEKVTEVNERRERVSRILAYARIGLPGQAMLILEWPWDDRDRRQTIHAESQVLELDFRNRAPGDLSTLVLVRALPRGRVAPWGLDVGAGVKWASGPADRADNGRTLPVEMQSGTGSTDPLFYAAFSRTWPGTAAQILGLARFSQPGRQNYRFGTETHLVAAAARTVRPWLSVGIETRFRSQGKDEIAGRNPPNTGGLRLMAGPRAGAVWSRARLAIEGAFLFPVHQDLNGTQLGISRQILVGVRWPRAS